MSIEIIAEAANYVLNNSDLAKTSTCDAILKYCLENHPDIACYASLDVLTENYVNNLNTTLPFDLRIPTWYVAFLDEYKRKYTQANPELPDLDIVDLRVNWLNFIISNYE